MMVVQVKRQRVPKCPIVPGGFFEQPLLNFARQVWPEAKGAATDHLRKPYAFAHRQPLAAAVIWTRGTWDQCQDPDEGFSPPAICRRAF
jgi:hypothetical protein